MISLEGDKRYKSTDKSLINTCIVVAFINWINLTGVCCHIVIPPLRNIDQTVESTLRLCLATHFQGLKLELKANS